MESLQRIADKAASEGNTTLYFSIREEMESLADPEETFIAPDTGNLIIENWKDSTGEIIPEAPNDMLLSNLYQSSVHSTSDAPKIAELLKARGYEEQDLFLAKHFRFKLEDNDGYLREVTSMEILRACNDIQNELQITPDDNEKDAFIQNRFRIYGRDTDITKAEGRKFITDYQSLLTEVPVEKVKTSLIVRDALHKVYEDHLNGSQSKYLFTNDISDILDDEDKHHKYPGTPSEAAEEIHRKLWTDFSDVDSTDSAIITANIFHSLDRASELGWISDYLPSDYEFKKQK